MIKSVITEVRRLCFPKHSIDDCVANTWSKQSPPSHDHFQAMTSCSIHSSCLEGDVIPAGRDGKAIHLSSTYPPQHSRTPHTNTRFFPCAWSTRQCGGCMCERKHVAERQMEGRADGWTDGDGPSSTGINLLPH